MGYGIMFSGGKRGGVCACSLLQLPLAPQKHLPGGVVCGGGGGLECSLHKVQHTVFRAQPAEGRMQPAEGRMQPAAAATGTSEAPPR
jgi:hypothetical protein